MFWPLLFIVAYGLCFGFQNDKAPFITGLLRKVSVLDKALSCTYCTGFHCGWMAWLLLSATSGLPAEGWHNLGSVIVAAFASSGLCYVVEAVVRWLEANTPSEG